MRANEDRPTPSPDTSAEQYVRERLAYWDSAARRMDTRTGRPSKSWGIYYHQRLTDIYRHLVTPGQKVIEFGCGQGDLLAALRPSVGVGVDFSPEMIRRARQRHPGLCFEQADVHDLDLAEQLDGADGTSDFDVQRFGVRCFGVRRFDVRRFDAIILSDLLSDVWDVQKVFEQSARLSGPHTRLIINSYSRVWELPLLAAQKLGLAQPVLYRNWLTVEDLANLASLADFEVIRHWQEILCPLPVPLLASFCNQVLVKLWPLNLFGLTNFILARPRPQPRTANGTSDIGGDSRTPVERQSVSVIVPARNEAGNIPEIFTRTPQMGGGTELVFVEGHSHDNTFETIQSQMTLHPERPCKLLKQSGIGKGNAVREGFAAASGDVLMILDADLTVPPEDLPRFYQALVSGKGELINGVRLVYPMEKQAMRFLNLLGNKFFTLTFSWVLGQPIKDTLCGTKALWRSDYEQITRNRAYFGDFDPFGDFDLIFGAVRLNRKIVDIPIRYRERKYGTTNIHRWKHGWLLIQMLIIAARRLKFI